MSMPEAVALQFQQHGEPDSEPLMLLHGLYGSGSNWARIAPTLAERFRVIVPDLRNHGVSPHHAEMSYPAMVADVLALLDLLDIERAHILGHSMGGKVAMHCALQAEHRLRRLIIADMAPRAYDGVEHQSIIDAMRQLDLTTLKSRRDADQALAAAVPVQAVRQFLLTNLQRRDKDWCWRLPLATLRDQLAAIVGWSTAGESFDGPTLFLHGGRSDYLGPGDQAAIETLFPRARLRCMENCGHWLHVEDPTTFGEEVIHFLENSVESG
ncbi:alpha/beta fold hydrolase [Methylonatrum kenyense]|uniref:alpha/beta fold hydrolase n=1 Tax=Methylonatrum kenyense TaxID=455253 RepID=UPI0020C17719|nr:alpha/beta fold hydrolase [Methylonatrum kenyense]MCK8515302.1 alpha/beta fold hydrolase [Methylonatrum kenyense]